ncbi:Protein PTHB1 [Homalodisca vitripennis]|nr:Protein PTHB1 [Homalodisca vitripennis]
MSTVITDMRRNGGTVQMPLASHRGKVSLGKMFSRVFALHSKLKTCFQVASKDLERDKTILFAQDKINFFFKKLATWLTRVEKNIFENFKLTNELITSLDQSDDDYPDIDNLSKLVTPHLQDLRDERDGGSELNLEGKETQWIACSDSFTYHPFTLDIHHQHRENLGQQTTQYRAIQRRLLSKLREKTVLPLVGLDRILADTHRQIVETSHAIEDTQLALAVCGCELSCEVRLVLTLVRLCDSTNPKDWADLAAAMSYVLHSSETQGWEEVCEPGVNYLLSTSLAKSVRDHQRTAVEALRDPTRFKKHITVALDRVMAGTAVKSREEMRGVSPIMEGEEDRASANQTLRRGPSDKEVYLKLLPTREALQTNGMKNV